MNETGETPAISAKTNDAGAQIRFQWIGWSSFFFAFVQSICTGFVALSGVRLLLGVAAFAAATGAMKFVDNKLHVDAIRIPMVVLALGGALVNLRALWQVRRLRARSSSAWRQKPISPGKHNSERLQFALSILTLLLLAAESWYHFKFTGHL
jgi:hypothetical protein